MVAFTPHTLVTFGGTLNERTSGDEIWQCGIRGINPVSNSPVDQAQLQAFVEQIHPGIAAWYGHVEAQHANQAHLNWIKVANIAPSGAYSGEPKFIDALTVVGGGDTPRMPSFCSIAISWGTGATFGKAQRGRIYPPNFSADLTAGTSHIDALSQGKIQSRAFDLLDALSVDEDEFAFRPHVMSSTGQHRLITEVRVGNVIDVQRRRKNAAAESYVAGFWPV